MTTNQPSTSANGSTTNGAAKPAEAPKPPATVTPAQGAPAPNGGKPAPALKPGEKSPETKGEGSDRWAAATAAEKRARAAADEAKKEREATAKLQKDLDERQTQLASREELIAKAKAGDWKAREQLLAESGITYDELTKRALNGRKNAPDPNAELKAKIESLEQKLAKRDEDAKATTEAEGRARLIATFAEVVKTGGEKKDPAQYELVADAMSSDPKWVEETLLEMAKQKPTLTYEGAAELLENHLLEETKRRLNLSKVKALATTPTSATTEAPKPSTTAAPPAKPEGPSVANGSRTLTNADAAERGTDPTPSAPVGKAYQRKAAEKDALRRAEAAITRGKNPG